MAKNGLPAVFSCSRPASEAPRPALAAERIANQLFKVFTGQRRKDDLLHRRSSLRIAFEVAHQRMGGIDFVVSVSTN